MYFGAGVFWWQHLLYDRIEVLQVLRNGLPLWALVKVELGTILSRKLYLSLFSERFLFAILSIAFSKESYGLIFIKDFNLDSRNVHMSGKLNAYMKSCMLKSCCSKYCAPCTCIQLTQRGTEECTLQKWYVPAFSFVAISIKCWISHFVGNIRLSEEHSAHRCRI